MEPLFGLYVILEPIRFAGKKLTELTKGEPEVKLNGHRKIVFEYVPKLPGALEEDIFEYTVQGAR